MSPNWFYHGLHKLSGAALTAVRHLYRDFIYLIAPLENQLNI